MLLFASFVGACGLRGSWGVLRESGVEPPQSKAREPGRVTKEGFTDCVSFARRQLAKLPPRSPAEVEFMQGMIMHHAQAVEMTALIPSHTQNKDLRSLGARISS